MKQQKIHINENGEIDSGASVSWVEVPGFNGRYEVSYFGLIRTNYNRDTPVLMNPSIISSGYLMAIFTMNSQRYRPLVHRIVAELFIPNPKQKPCVNHKDGNKLNNAVPNLEWNTYSENHKHAYRNNIRVWTNESRKKVSESQLGADNSFTKLTERDVVKIRELSKSHTYKEIAELFDMSHWNIGRIVRGETWSHI